MQNLPILFKKQLNENTFMFRIEAPLIARKAQSGQFILIRPNDNGERIPLTIADYDRDAGWIAIIFQVVGGTTMQLSQLDAGQTVLDVTGPLGRASELEGYEGKHVAVIGGGLGCAIAYPQAKRLHELGAKVDVIAGFRTKDLIMLEDEMRPVCENLVLLTDDGSNGNRGLVTDGLQKLIDGGTEYSLVIAIGPPIMMKFVCKLTEKYNIKTVVSLNPIMVDGTGMCGGCRVSVGGKMKFACVDGPDFDGRQVDFDELMKRLRVFNEQEKQSYDHECNLLKMAQ